MLSAKTDGGKSCEAVSLKKKESLPPPPIPLADVFKSDSRHDSLFSLLMNSAQQNLIRINYDSSRGLELGNFISPSHRQSDRQTDRHTKGRKETDRHKP